MNRVSIPEETPSMVQLEHNNKAMSKSTEPEVRRILPEVPKMPPERGIEPGSEPDIVPKPKVSPKPNIPQEKVKSTKGTKLMKSICIFFGIVFFKYLVYKVIYFREFYGVGA